MLVWSEVALNYEEDKISITHRISLWSIYSSFWSLRHLSRCSKDYMIHSKWEARMTLNKTGHIPWISHIWCSLLLKMYRLFLSILVHVNCPESDSWLITRSACKWKQRTFSKGQTYHLNISLKHHPHQFQMRHWSSEHNFGVKMNTNILWQANQINCPNILSFNLHSITVTFTRLIHCFRSKQLVLYTYLAFILIIPLDGIYSRKTVVYLPNR